MHLTLVSPFDPFPQQADGEAAHVGGVERVYAEVATRLADRGHDVHLICSTDGPSGQDEHRGISLTRRHRTTTVFRAPACRLHREIGSTDLVQVPATYPLTAPTVLRHAQHAGLPAVLDFHFEPRPPSAVGKAAAQVYRALGPATYPSATLVTVRSHAYAESAPSLEAVPESKLRVVPNGIDRDRFRPEGPQEGQPILFVGRLVPYKGLEVLLKALAMAPHIDRELVVAGDGPLRDDLEALAGRLDVEATFLGYVPDEQLPNLYRDAALTVLPSVNGQEAFGITLLESMACGTPVVASELPGVAEVARLGGLTAPPGDPQALAEQLEGALAPGRLDRGSALAEPIRRTYSWEAVTDRFEAAYREILEGSQPSGEPPTAAEVPAR